mmetsp:Transcript_26211/g.43398  ORF Transcript_26211/g.43398 Transcript_26211/m.43398 type:complete len:259 (+) Transcript_26211:2337-3113(+)
MNHAQLLELACRDDNAMLAEQGHVRHVRRPHHIFDDGCAQLCHRLTLLDVEKTDAFLGSKQQCSGARREQAVGTGMRRCTFLCHLVLEVLDQYLPILVEHRETLTRDKNGRGAQAALALLHTFRGPTILWHVIQLIRPTVCVKANQQHALLLIVVDAASNIAPAGTGATNCHQWRILASTVLIRTHVPLFDEKHAVLHRGERRTLAFQLEDDHASVVTSGQQVAVLVHSEDPEAIMLAPESLNTLALRHVPHANGLVF